MRHTAARVGVCRAQAARAHAAGAARRPWVPACRAADASAPRKSRAQTGGEGLQLTGDQLALLDDEGMRRVVAVAP